MKRYIKITIGVFLVLGISTMAAENGCVHCHDGLAPIRAHKSGMMQAILKKAKEAGAKGNDCVVCHGGNASVEDNKTQAHSGTLKYFLSHEGPKDFYPYPASPWINANTCGMCHKTQVSAQWNNLMATEQGKIHGAIWGFGAKEG
ncbi:MAG TPA: cytochrome C, partial [Epsilonproteobacteria bacterium]|nr:cytochrome C [Campylobacterota bacterium]